MIRCCQATRPLHPLVHPTTSFQNFPSRPALEPASASLTSFLQPHTSTAPRIGRICRRLSAGARPSSCASIPAPFPPHPSTARVDDRPLRPRPPGSGPMSCPRSLRRLLSPALSPGSGPVAVLPVRAAPPATPCTWAASPKPSSSLAGRQPAKCLATQTTPKPPPRDLAPICFNSTVPRFNTPSGLNPREPDSERKVKLGKSKHAALYPVCCGH